MTLSFAVNYDVQLNFSGYLSSMEFFSLLPLLASVALILGCAEVFLSATSP